MTMRTLKRYRQGRYAMGYGLVALVLAASACSSKSNDSGFSASAPGDTSGSSDDSTGNAGSPGAGGGNGFADDADGGASVPALPPEVKIESNFKSPVSTGGVIWSVNPSSGRVAYVTAATLDVQTVEAGNSPTYLAAVPDPTDDVVVVLNVLSQDATVLRDHARAISAQTFPTKPGLNSLAVDATGRFVVAWSDATQTPNADPTQGFQDITVIDLKAGSQKAVDFSVGYRPVKVAFSQDSSHAYLVTQDGISVIALTAPGGPAVSPLVPIDATVVPAPPVDAGASDASADAATDAATDAAKVQFIDSGSTSASSSPDVSFTPDGAYALVRQDGSRAIVVIALATGTSTTVLLPTAPTDLTLSPKGDFAAVALRDSASLAILPLPGIVGNAAAVRLVPVPGEIVGRVLVTDDGSKALVFTTVADVQRINVVTLGAAPSILPIRLYSPVAAVFPTHDGQSAIVLHRLLQVSSANVQGAFSVVPLTGTEPPKIVSLPAAPTAVALAQASDHALITTASPSYGAYLVALPSMVVTTYPLASPPIAAGIATAAGRAYIAQDHPEGRITFVDFAGGQAHTITGFELGARIVDGSGQ